MYVMTRSVLVALAIVLSSVPVTADELCPKYGSCVPADQFNCREITTSSLVTRVCYSGAKEYMVVRLKQTDYHYCAIDAQTVKDFLTASSMGLFYNERIKVNANDGKFSCQTHPVPTF
jgi:hypothetical protein